MTTFIKLCRSLAVGLTGAATLLSLAACGGEPRAAANIAVIVGRYAHASPMLDGSGRAIPVIAAALEQVLQGPGTLTVIADDGRPRAVRTIKLKYDDRSPQLRRDAIAANHHALDEALLSAGPLVSQADPTAALKLGGDAVRGKPNSAVLMFDPGLSTSGSVLMQLGLIDVGSDIPSLTQQSRGQLVGSLSGVVVHWYGVCALVAPQPACSAGVQAQLQEYYRRLVTDAGGKVVYDDAPLAGGTAAAELLPPVDVVRWKTHRVTAPSPTGRPTTPPILAVLTQDVIRFLPNSDAYADPAKAGTVIAELAVRLQADRYPTAEVVGCTARDPGSTEAQMDRRAVSRAATIVRDLQVNKATTRFSVRGLGWRCPGYRAGEDEANRRVIVSSEPVR